MDDSYCLLPERVSEQFSEIDSDIVMDLAAASPEYTELKAQMEELKRQNPVIGALLEGKGELSFTAEEHEALKELIRLYMRADNMEREHIYFRGHADGFAYLKKIGAFKTEKLFGRHGEIHAAFTYPNSFAPPKRSGTK